jgi:tyrosine-protein kinase Etk/Wzc
MSTNNREHLMGVMSTLYRWRKAIRNVCIAALLLAIGGTLMMDNYYKATSIFYPASPELASPELIFGTTGQVTNYFGTDRDLDRIAEIANSTEVVDYMVQKFGLYTHYGIDSTSRKGRAKVREIFRGLYSALKNKNDAIELSVEDTDPDLAAAMANAARLKINEIAQRLIKNSQATLLATFEDNMNRKKQELDLLADSLRQLQATYNIFNVGTQSDRLSGLLAEAEADIIRNKARLQVLQDNPLIPKDTVEYIKADLRASEKARENLMSRGSGDRFMNLKGLNDAGPIINVMSDLHFQARKQLSYDIERYNQIKATFKTDIPAIQLIEAAEVPLEKSRPKRSILVIASVFAAFLFSALGVLLIESFRDIDWKSGAN